MDQSEQECTKVCKSVQESKFAPQSLFLNLYTATPFILHRPSGIATIIVSKNKTFAQDAYHILYSKTPQRVMNLSWKS